MQRSPRAARLTGLAIPTALVVLFGLALPLSPGPGLGSPAPPPAPVRAAVPIAAIGAGAELLAQARASLSAGGGPGPSALPPPSTHVSRPAARGWTPREGAPDVGGWLLYDAADAYVVDSFPSSSGNLLVTYTYQNGTWTFQDSATAPSYCAGSVAAYDSLDGYVLYQGGANCSASNSTWAFQAGQWMRLHPSREPTARDGGVLVDDPHDGYVLYYGGSLCGASCTRSWAFRNGSWTELPASVGPVPSAQYSGETAAYDATNAEVVLLGDASHRGVTWTWTSGNWSSHTNAGTAGYLEYAPMSTDPAGGVIVFGGEFNGTKSSNETWQFVNGTWSMLTTGPGAPLAGSWTIAEVGPSAGLLIVGNPSFGSSYREGVVSTFGFNGSAWTNRSTALPPPQFSPGSMVYDAGDGYVLLVGSKTIYPYGSNVPESLPMSWTFVKGRWSNVTSAVQPAARSSEGLAYDARDGYVILFGGTEIQDQGPSPCGPVNHFDYCGDTWEYAAGIWKQLTPPVSPSNRTYSQLVYDAADGYLLLTGGECPNSSPAGAAACSDVWNFSAGRWTNITTNVSGRPPTQPVTAVYDPADRYVLLLYAGTVGSNWEFDQTWTYRGGRFTNITSTIRGTVPQTDASFAEDPVGHQLIAVAGVGPNSAYGEPIELETYSYSNGTWANLSRTFAPNEGHVSLVEDARDRTVIAFGSYFECGAPSCTGGLGPNGIVQTWTWSPEPVAPLVVASVGSSRIPTDVDQPTNLSLNATGGVAPLSYSYVGLPPGCSSANRSPLLCRPTALGNYSFWAIVSDAAGHRASVILDVVVGVGPRILSFTAQTDPVGIGHRTVLEVNASGGVAPWSYRYSGLPPGCSGQDVPLLPCAPAGSGRYAINVTVTDAAGGSVNASLNLTVKPVGLRGLRVTEFLASPSALYLGNATVLTVRLHTNASWVRYRYRALPTGCHSSNASSLTCTPQIVGSFLITVIVTDNWGASVKVQTQLSVYDPPASVRQASGAAHLPSRTGETLTPPPSDNPAAVRPAGESLRS